MMAKDYSNWCEICGKYVYVSGGQQTLDGDDIYSCGHTQTLNNEFKKRKEADDSHSVERISDRPWEARKR